MGADLDYACLDDWLNWLEQQHPSHTIALGLARIARVAGHLLAEGPIARQVITVAGTNGKGSTLAYLASILHQAGLRYGALTSPHLLHFNERIALQGKPVDEQALCAAFKRVNQARYQAAAEPVPLTYFEFNALLAFDLMQRADLDVALLEIGLGGRLDAVNLVDADIAILTSIGLDHQEWLGHDLATIGREKAGIFRSGKPAICGEPSAPLSVAGYAAEVGAHLLCRGVDFDASPRQWHGPDATGKLHSLALPWVSLPAINVAAVVQAVKLLPFDIVDQAIIDGLQQARLAGRFQQETVAGKQVILDVAHNAPAAVHLAAQLQASPVAGCTWAVMGMLNDKDYPSVIHSLEPQIDHWQLASVTGIRGLSAGLLGQAVADAGVHGDRWQVFDTVTAAFQDTIQRADDGDRIVVFGSFVTVSVVLQAINPC